MQRVARLCQRLLALNLQKGDVCAAPRWRVLQRHRILLQVHSTQESLFPETESVATCSDRDHLVGHHHCGSRAEHNQSAL